ncbi:MAG: mechanosensitive ion channel domain-containing protein [Methanomassiliicoccales archaeon]
MRKGVLLLVFAILLMGTVAMPLSSAQSVSLFEVDDYEKRIDASQTVTFEWVVYNNGTSDWLVEPRLETEHGDRWEATITPVYATLEPNQSQTFVLEIVPDRNSPTVTLDLDMTFECTRMDSPQETVNLEGGAELKILSLFGTNAGENKLFGIWQNPLPPPLDSNYGAFLVTVLGWLAIGFLIFLVVSPIVHHFTQRTRTVLDDMILRIVKGPVLIIIVIYGMVSSLEILNLPIDLIALIEITYQVMIIAIIAWLVYKVYDVVLTSVIGKYAKRTKTDADKVLVPVMEKIGMVIIPVIALIALLNVFGFDVTGLLAGMGLLSLVIAFAAQDTLSNYFAGLSIIMDRPFKIGETIQLDDEILEVKKIGMRSTTFYNIFKNDHVMIPNSDVATMKIVNLVKPDLKYKFSVTVGVAYGSDLELVKRLIGEAVEEHPNTLVDDFYKYYVRFQDFADSSLVFAVYAWVDSVMNQWRAASDIRESIDRKFREHGITIPFPQRTVWFNEAGKE